MSTIYNFYFSKSQCEERKAIELNAGYIFIPGTVIINGSVKQYTEMSTGPVIKKYSDSVYLGSGDIDQIIYTDHQHKPKVR